MDATGTLEWRARSPPARTVGGPAQALRQSSLHAFFSDAACPPNTFYSMGIAAPITRSSGASRNWPATPSRTSRRRRRPAAPKAFISFIHKLRAAAYPDITIMAGDVVTGEMTEELILDGVDIVKVGIGRDQYHHPPHVGSRLSPALGDHQCADAAHGLRGLICADGGCTWPGDLAKAFGAGAGFVMLGGMLAGHDECGTGIVR